LDPDGHLKKRGKPPAFFVSGRGPGNLVTLGRASLQVYFIQAANYQNKGKGRIRPASRREDGLVRGKIIGRVNGLAENLKFEREDFILYDNKQNQSDYIADAGHVSGGGGGNDCHNGHTHHRQGITGI
jgi:hypothetical protein